MGRLVYFWVIVALGVIYAVFLDDGYTSMDVSLFEKPTNGSLVTLSHGGNVHYVLRGPESGPLVVLVHGITSNSECLQWLSADLAKNGFRVLSYDLYGRGLSDPRPGETHNADLYVRQLHELLEKLNLGYPKFDLIGNSMGGAIGVHFSAQYPDRIRNLVLVSPAGMPFELPIIAKLILWPYVGELLTTSAIGRRKALDRARKEVFKSPEKIQEQYDYVQSLTHFHVFKKHGYFPTITADLRQFPFTNCTEAYRRVGEGKFPVQIIWGTIDNTTPYTGAQQALDLIPRASLVTIPDASHLAILEEHFIVHPEIIKFLKKNTQ